MRNKLGEWIISSVAKDNKIILLSGDIGFGIFDKFIEKFPNNFLNCGIAEQNMIGVASGLASQGFKPIVYTIIPFLIYRPFEFIRNLIAYQNLDVTLIGVGGGFSYDNLGYTHFGVEDLNLINTLPNFTILTPYDPLSAVECYDLAISFEGPKYIRLMKGGEPFLYPSSIQNQIHIFSNFGDNYTIITHGSLVDECIKAANILNMLNIKGKVVSSLNIKNSNINEYLNGNIYSFEEAVFPGMFNLIKSPAINHQFIDNSIDYKFGTRNDYLEINKLNSSSIVQKIKKDFYHF